VAQRVVVGLGNPGADYEGTRHNVGFAVAARLRDRLGAKPLETTPRYAAWARDELVVLTPLTYMNLSGAALEEFGERHGLEAADLLVVVDDVYLPLGALRVRARGSDGGHNGLASVAASLGTDDYARLRIGVGRGDLELRDHVLSGFAPEEGETLTGALDAACEASLLWAREGVIAAMNRFNARIARDNAPEGER
jgi:PTH1 family peptidyl-tRNA hydrolase